MRTVWKWNEVFEELVEQLLLAIRYEGPKAIVEYLYLLIPRLVRINKRTLWRRVHPRLWEMQQRRY
jgi:hypothetical protein